MYTHELTRLPIAATVIGATTTSNRTIHPSINAI